MSENDWEPIEEPENDWEPIATPSEPGFATKAIETAQDAATGFANGVPGSGIAGKLGSAATAGLTAITPNALLPKNYQDKSLGDLYGMNEEARQADLSAAQNRSPIANNVGSVAGAFGSVPGLPSAAVGKASAAKESVMNALTAKFGDRATEAAGWIAAYGADKAAQELGVPPSTVLILKAILGAKK